MKYHLMDNKPDNPIVRILLIEDDTLDQMAFTRMVREQNLAYECTMAASVAKAKAVLNNEMFDVVIIDYFLGDGTAFDVLDSVRNTPIIFATGAGTEELAVEAMKAGAKDYLIKDPDRNYLKILPETIKKSLSRKRMEDELRRYHSNLEILVKERTEQLAEEKELLAVTLSSMGDGVIAVDNQKRITLFNKVAEELTGWRFQEIPGMIVDGIFRLLDEKTMEMVQSPIEKVLKSGQAETLSSHKTLAGRNGRNLPVYAMATPIRRGEGGVIGVVMVFRDISKEREVEQMKADFISMMSHELRTPLTSIKAYTETILCTPEMPEETKHQFLMTVDEESNRLAGLVESILEISRIESGTVKLESKPVNVPDVAAAIALALKPLADKKNISLISDIETGIPAVLTDESAIQSIVTNIANNAIKFTPDGGNVRIEVKHTDEDLILRVADTGMGIPKEDLPKIFDKFYRVRRTGKQIQGTGLGLAVVKEIVTMLGGRIEVQSEINKGTVFKIVLPLKTVKATDIAVVS